MRDFDFHPDEDSVRCFRYPDLGTVFNDESTWVSQTRQASPYETMTEDLILRHFAFADEWFKINATFDRAGTLIQPGPPGTPFAINCDIATPMVRVDQDVSAVDLFLDVLVRTDGSYWVADQEEFEQAIVAGLISAGEAHRAERGLERLISWIESGRVESLVHDFDLDTVGRAPRALPVEHWDVGDVPSVARLTRSTWHLEV